MRTCIVKSLLKQDGARCTPYQSCQLMTEVTHTGEDHRHTVFVGGINHLLVAH
ncbi:Uncharacterised protein [Vibrio cholerae]|nr:Uncharacterised protein [Vibrio cholerae]